MPNFGPRDPMREYVTVGRLALALLAIGIVSAALRPPIPRGPWQLHLADGCGATWQFIPDSPTVVRVHLTRLPAVSQPWFVKFTTDLPLQHGTTVKVTFRARGDVERPVGLRVYVEHPPWSDAGLNEAITVGPEWRTFEFNFHPTLTSRFGRFSWELGANLGDVEIADFHVDVESNERKLAREDRR